MGSGIAQRSMVIPALLLLLWGCGDDGPGGNTNQNGNACPAGHERQGPACIPSFDDCPGRAEIPVLGGGCQAVGVTACATGFVADGEGGCDAILPDAPCAPGTLEVLGETECQPVGVLACAAGFESDGEGGCNAILPTEPCPYGTLEVLGETECQPLGDCGDGPWGSLAIDAQTVFVDASAEAAGADGTEAHPFPTLEAAYAAVPAGGQIAIAAGEYLTRLVIGKAVRLTGRCAALVTLRGQSVAGQDRPPITIGSSGTGTTIQGVTLTGNGAGLVVNAATGVVVTESQIVEVGDVGISAAQAELRLERVRVVGSTQIGVDLYGAEATVVDTVVRDTRPSSTGSFGRGINAECVPDGQGCGRLDVSGSLIAGNAEFGVGVFGVDARIAGSVVRETRSTTPPWWAQGILAACDFDGQRCARLDVSGSLVAGNAEIGVQLSGAEATITGSVVQGTRPSASGERGQGIWAQCDAGGQGCGRLDVTRTLVAGNAEQGVVLSGVAATITGTVVRETRPDASGELGQGIYAQCAPDGQSCGRLDLAGSLIAGNAEIGVAVVGVAVTIAGSVVRDTRPWASGVLGRGVHAQCDPDERVCGRLGVSGSLIAGNAEVGILVSGVETSIASSVVRETLPSGSGELGRGLHAECDADGQGCGRLEVAGSLVVSNTEVGVLVSGVETAITGSVVRETLPSASGMGRGGLAARCSPDGEGCGRLDVTGSLVAGNTSAGVVLAGVEATISGSVVRDTLPSPDGKGGRGLHAQCDPDGQGCGRLDVTGALVAGNSLFGIGLVGVPATLSGVAVLDTRENTEGSWVGDFGQALFARCDPTSGACGTLGLQRCLVRSAFSAGVAVEGVSGSIQGSVVEQVAPRALDDRFGYGIQVAPGVDGAPVVFHVRDCRVIDADLAGLLYASASGTVSGTEVSGAAFSVVWTDPGLAPTLTGDNVLSGTVGSDPSLQTAFRPAPAPPPVDR
jgi:hypothetical protein